MLATLQKSSTTTSGTMPLQWKEIPVEALFLYEMAMIGVDVQVQTDLSKYDLRIFVDTEDPRMVTSYTSLPCLVRKLKHKGMFRVCPYHSLSTPLALVTLKQPIRKVNGAPSSSITQREELFPFYVDDDDQQVIDAAMDTSSDSPGGGPFAPESVPEFTLEEYFIMDMADSNTPVRYTRSGCPFVDTRDDDPQRFLSSKTGIECSWKPVRKGIYRIWPTRRY